MKTYIRENWKVMSAIALLVGIITGFTMAGELSAKLLPDISELTLLDYQLDKNTFEYDAKEKKPVVKSLTFSGKENQKVVIETDAISSVKYVDNVKCGFADIKISVDGYQGTVELKNAFQIYPTKVEGLKIVNSSRESIELAWEAVDGADGYFIYKKSTSGAPGIAERIKGGNTVNYKETGIQTNTIYTYYVKAYVTDNEKDIYGTESETAVQASPLETAVLTSATSQSYKSVLLQWNAVPGAAGYQVYRSEKKGGEYAGIAEIKDGSTTGYTDNNCECGKEYFYYIKACQSLETGNVYGEASQTLSVTVTPNKTSLSGNISQDRTQVTVAWKQSQGARGYELYRKAGTANYELIKKFDGSEVLSYTDSNLSKEVEYRYRVRPFCVIDGKQINSPYSNTFTKEVIIVFNYTPGEISANMAKVLELQGTPYRWGGTDPRGWDCSGFTSWAMKNCFGVTIPRTSGGQAYAGQSVSLYDRSTWRPGDILCYTAGGRYSHVAIYIGNGQMIHALNPKRGTFVQSVDQYEGWDENTLTRVRRVF